ncbi:MAG: hypothetical protein RL660_2449 [Bacteroidota bacterium]|jgi:D-glycero-alpha-D-manno-heptose-7-phosphate kinase
MLYRSKAPLRLGLAGGGTDVSPYSEDFGGAVLNMTISLFAHATIEPIDTDVVYFNSFDRGESEEYSLSDSASLPLTGTLDLHKGAFNHVRAKFGWDRSGFRLSTYVDAPAGSGLGTSSTLVVAIVGAFVKMLGLPLSDYDIAQMAYEIERNELGLAGGKQDQYAATFGGVNFMEFSSGDKVLVNQLRVRSEYISEIENNLLLFYTETSRDSATIIEKQSKQVASGNSKSIEAMHMLKRQAFDMKEALLKGQVHMIGKLLHEGFEYKRQTAKEVSNTSIDDIYNTALAAGASGGKISGAGGGGFMVFYCDHNNRYAVIKALENKGCGSFMKYQIVQHGLKMWTVQ